MVDGWVGLREIYFAWQGVWNKKFRGQKGGNKDWSFSDFMFNTPEAKK